MQTADLQVLHAANDPQIAVAFSTVRERKTDGLVITTDPIFTARSEQPADPAALLARADEVIE